MKKSIEELAWEKEWGELGSAEQQAVLSMMDKAAYLRLREVLLLSKELDASLQPPARLRANLLAKMEQSSALSPVKYIWEVRIPLWQAAAAVLAGMVLMGLLKPQSVVMDSSTPNIVQVRDTLVQEKMVWKDRIVQKTKVVYRDTSSTAPQINLAPKGVSLEDAPELMSLFTQAEK
ncbi:hypothetical protein [Haliscomenobacter hydrossis]|uniref:Uncharacterized protein n=1 Tax=Haliscomenobacter hydrossis (strain ATCC 27775 / DSM 1100 / LMG 10767 / O) TaxID=760192 RepID=F4KR05_HALH1|nr:hypothetical protein [Haliscomenobacter hydrossis]AEE53243.1 hypothetical protein Halhy_5418 [Haliscomenobacter hydrossis DSM 1100]